MKLDKRHLIVSLALLIGSIIYNVWVFTRPAAGRPGVTAGVAVDAAASAPASGTAGSAPVDPAQVKPPADVALDRLPAWPRDPFANPRPPQPLVVDTATAPEPAPEPDPEVASILYATDRRLAMINGRVVRVGDTLAGSNVVDILPNAVIIESPERGRRTLALRPPGGRRSQ